MRALTLAALALLVAAGPPALAPGDVRELGFAAGTHDEQVLEIEIPAGGAFAVEARSPAFDVALTLCPQADGAACLNDDNGLGGTDAQIAAEAAPGARYRLAVRRGGPLEEAAGTVTITVRAGAAAARGDDAAYWTGVRDAGDAQHDAWLSVRGRCGLLNLAFEAGDYARGKTLGRDAERIATDAWGAHDGRLGAVLGDLGVVLGFGGDAEEGIAVLRRALAILESAYPQPDPRVVTTRNTLGTLLDDQAELLEARDVLERAVADCVALHGTDEVPCVPARANLAGVQDNLGDWERALEGYRAVLQITERTQGPDTPRVASLLNNVGYELRRLGRRDEAIPLYRRALAIREAKLGPDHPSTALSLQNLGVALRDAGEGDRGEELLRRALSIRERRLGDRHPDVATTLLNLAMTLHERGRAAEALPLAQRALAIRREVLGDAHPETTAARVTLATLEQALGQRAAALRDALDAEARGRAAGRAVARHLPERLALRYATLRGQGLRVAYAALDGAAAADVRAVWDSTIRSRALVLDAMAARRAALREDDPPATRAARATLERAAEHWARIASGAAGLRGAELLHALDAAEAQREAAERALGETSAGFHDELHRVDAGLADVLKALAPGSALVSYVRYHADARGEAGEDAYGAFVVAPPAAPRFVRLGPAAALDAAIGTWRERLGGASGDVAADRQREADALARGQAVRRLAWDPLAAALGSARRVVVVPDGLLHFVPFAALADARGRYLLESGPAFEYASAERDLAAPATGVATADAPLLALGGPAFDDTPGAAAATYRGAAASCDGFRALRFAPLAHAGDEAREVVELVGHGARALTGASASEAAFKALAPRSGALHLATHGFVLAEGCAKPHESPLHLSGLALAGANRRGASPADAEDGVLTAEEIAALDLSRVAWVALSACDTGTGSLAAGEGVLGLRRAFAVAGARTLLTSLFAVDDRDARRFMLEVYRARFAQGLATADAVRTAARALLDARRARKLDTSPVHWGAFVAVGR